MNFKINNPQYYVGVLTNKNEIVLITEVDREHSTFRYEKGKEPVKFTKATAEEMVIALGMNFVSAVVVYS